MCSMINLRPGGVCVQHLAMQCDLSMLIKAGWRRWKLGSPSQRCNSMWLGCSHHCELKPSVVMFLPLIYKVILLRVVPQALCLGIYMVKGTSNWKTKLSIVLLLQTVHSTRCLKSQQIITARLDMQEPPGLQELILTRTRRWLRLFTDCKTTCGLIPILTG